MEPLDKKPQQNTPENCEQNLVNRVFSKGEAGGLRSEDPSSLELKAEPGPRNEDQEIGEQIMKTED